MSKYKAKKTKIDGITFDSKMEANYYGTLKMRKMAGEIVHFDIHPIVTLPGNIQWKLDFIVYYPDKRIEAIDVKGFETQAFKLKQKLFNSTHPLAPLAVIKKLKGKIWQEC